MIKFGIGQAVRRVEDRRFLTGQGRYVDDIALSGMCHGVNVLSPHAHARIKNVDISKAKAAPGVLLVLTGADFKHDQLGGFTAAMMRQGSRRAERSPHLPSSFCNPKRRASSVTASPSSSPKRSRRRVMPPTSSRSTMSRCRRWRCSKMPPRMARRKCGTTIQTATSHFN